MPFYDYYCSECEDRFYVKHSMSEECTECTLCGSNNVERMVATVAYKINKNKFSKKAGDLVKSHIEDTRREVKEEKERMKRGI
jgi:putative FmdB family regulatory protein|tara:strand:- start:8 stop:256 length:249 start_codon:yes stop_codon:yes gene_type:complete